MSKNNDGKKRFLKLMRNSNNSTQGENVEFGTYYKDGVLPDSYPDGAEKDNDYYILSNLDLKDGDRVLIIWTTDEMVIVGKIEGGANE